MGLLLLSAFESAVPPIVVAGNYRGVASAMVMTTAPIKPQAIELTRGDDFGATLTFDQLVAGFAEIWFTVRVDWAKSETDDTAAVFSGTLTGGQIALTGTYTATIDIPDEATRLWSGFNYVYDVQIRTTAGKVYTTQRGKITVGYDVTRSV